MSFNIHSIESAPDASRALLEKLVESYGFLPNLAAGLAESPAALGGYLGLAGVYEAKDMTLDPLARQVVLLTTSVANGCDYCAAAHSMLAQHSGLDLAEVDRLVAGGPLQDVRLEALRAFTASLVEKRGWVPDEELEGVLEAGFDRAQVLEILLGVTLKTLSNYANHLIRPEINAQFAAYAPKQAA